MAPIRCCFDQTAVWHSDAARGPSTPSLDHLVGGYEQLVRYCQVECLRGLQIDHQFELGLPFDWQVAWLGTAKNPTHINTGLTIRLRIIVSVTHQATIRDELTGWIDCGNCVARRQRN